MAKKATTMMIRMIAVHILILLQAVSFSFAECARVMSDQELDQIHAGGFDIGHGQILAQVLDVVAGSRDGKFFIAVDKATPVFPMINPAGGGASNSVNISETAQQFLSSLVNINAAGSVVPVLLNLNIVIDSYIENFNTSNYLNLINYTTFMQP